MKTTKPRGRPPHPDLLTPAEWQVVNLAQHGLTNQKIADSLQVSINAVKYHLTNAVGKLQVIKGSGVTDKQSLLQFLGAPKDSALNRTPAMHNMLNINIQSVGQISRTVADISESEAWYRDVLGLTHLYTYGQLAFFDVDGVRLFLSQQDAQRKQQAAESIIYFKTQDIKSSHERLTELGVEFTHAPHKVHTHEDGSEEWMAFFNDLEGRPLALMAQYK